jgi:Zinc carboxypeptidase
MSHAARRSFVVIALAQVLALAATAPRADDPYAPDTPEPGSVQAIARFTTEPRFLSPWVAYVPASDTVPSPTHYLGHLVGAPGELSHTAQIQGYVRALAQASPRVRVETIGRTEEGRDIVLAVIADEAGIRDLDRLKAATAALADPRRTAPDQAEAIIATARPIYYFNCGLHADETGSGEMCMELAYRLAVSEQPMIRRIRDKLVVLINPISEPDGRDKMADWFYRYLKGKTDYDALPRMSPPYWNRYVYVDINRDAHQLAFGVTRAVHDMFFEYHPTVVHDLHEAIALLQTWNGTGPYNPHLDPIVTSQFLEMSLHEVTTMTAMGMPGVWTWNFGESFGLHFLDSVAMNHNSVGRGYETFGNTTAETVSRRLHDGGTEQEDYQSREWYRPLPSPQSFRWSMRDDVNYQETGALSILDWSACHAAEMLHDFYRTGFNSWSRGTSAAPYAFIIPQEQDDRLRVAGMINRLLDQKIEVGRLTADLAVKEGRFPRGSFIVKLDQPYRNYAVDLLEPQRFPAESENLPYDDVSWAFPVGFGVTAVRIDDARVKTAPSEPLRAAVAPRGRVDGDGAVFLLRDTGQETLLAARVRLARFKVGIAGKAFRSGSIDYPAGSWIVPRQDGLRAALESVARELALDFRGAGKAPEVPRHDAPLPRLGVWVPWADTDLMGWIRLVLDHEAIPYTYLRDEDVRAGGLKQKVDVILYGPFSRLELQGQIHGIAPTDGPMAFDKTPETPSLGAPVSSSDITGGPGYVGLEAVRRFVDEGGVLLTLGGGSTLALEGGLVGGVQRALDTHVFTPGSELRLTFARPDHPIAYGYGRETSVFRNDEHVYNLPLRWDIMAYCTSCLEGPVDRRFVVSTWGGSGPMVVSGGMRGEADLAGRPAILDVPIGRGRVVAYNFSPIHRDMNRSDYRLLWNAILNWTALDAPR